MFNLKNKKNGFTLIELLVVISIISLLSSVVLSSLSAARMKARDSRRIQDLRQIKIALEMYRNDYGNYPNHSTFCTIDPEWCLSSNNDDWSISLGGELNKYISKLSKDPLINNGQPFYNNDFYSYAYTSCSDGNCYDLLAKLEDPSSPYRCELKNYKRFFDTIIPNWQCSGTGPLHSRLLYSAQN